MTAIAQREVLLSSCWRANSYCGELRVIGRFELSISTCQLDSRIA